MNNELTMQSGLVEAGAGKATLLEMRADAERFPRLRNIPTEKAVEGIARIVTQAFMLRGHTADPTNVQFISSALVSALMEDDRYGASNISIEEVGVVVRRAVLESDIFVSVSSLYKVVMDYIKGEGHANQMKVDEAARKKAVPHPIAQAYAGEMIRNQRKM